MGFPKTEPARLLTYQAARYIDRRKGSEVPKFCAMAKFFASDTAMEVVRTLSRS